MQDRNDFKPAPKNCKQNAFKHKHFFVNDAKTGKLPYNRWQTISYPCLAKSYFAFFTVMLKCSLSGNNIEHIKYTQVKENLYLQIQHIVSTTPFG